MASVVFVAQQIAHSGSFLDEFLGGTAGVVAGPRHAAYNATAVQLAVRWIVLDAAARAVRKKLSRALK